MRRKVTKKEMVSQTTVNTERERVMQESKSTKESRRRSMTIRAVGIVLAGLLVMTAVFTGIVRGRVNSRNSGANPLAAPSASRSEAVSATASSNQQGGRDETRIELSSSGFMPAEIAHSAGSFAIAVENVNVTGEYTLQLKTEGGAVVSELKVQKGSSAWSVNLQSGNYTLTEINHPQWICRITVQ